MAKKKNRSKSSHVAKKGKIQSNTNLKDAINISQRLVELQLNGSRLFSSLEKDMTSIFKSAHAKELETLRTNLEEAQKLLSDQTRLLRD
jgi:hypothetical protein